MVIKNTTLRIEETYLKNIKWLALKQETTQTEIINQFIKEGLIKNGFDVE